MERKHGSIIVIRSGEETAKGNTVIRGIVIEGIVIEEMIIEGVVIEEMIIEGIAIEEIMTIGEIATDMLIEEIAIGVIMIEGIMIIEGIAAEIIVHFNVFLSKTITSNKFYIIRRNPSHLSFSVSRLIPTAILLPDIQDLSRVN